MPTKKDEVYGDHISHKFNNELMELKTEFLKMGGMVESQVENAIQALVDGDGHLADEIRANDKKVDRMEVEIDEEATLIIARRQPTARDLRLVISVIKMVADLERVGDEAKKIAKLAIKLQEEGQAPRGYVEVRHIGTHVLSMLHDALDAFARLDS
ncbi:MAG: phosphate signaling complex protein PhoU, partial [Marinobacter sp.]|nr:phosphate signaling complex protein PhoU [Marinobacter sp.]